MEENAQVMPQGKTFKQYLENTEMLYLILETQHTE